MITHMLLWNYRDEVSPAERQAIEAEMAGLPAAIPELQRLTLGPVVRWRVREYSHGAVMTFADLVALDAYQGHPAHKAFAARFHPATHELVAIDVESAMGEPG